MTLKNNLITLLKTDSTKILYLFEAINLESKTGFIYDLAHLANEEDENIWRNDIAELILRCFNEKDINKIIKSNGL